MWVVNLFLWFFAILDCSLSHPSLAPSLKECPGFEKDHMNPICQQHQEIPLSTAVLPVTWTRVLIPAESVFFKLQWTWVISTGTWLCHAKGIWQEWSLRSSTATVSCGAEACASGWTDSLRGCADPTSRSFWGLPSLFLIFNKSHKGWFLLICVIGNTELVCFSFFNRDLIDELYSFKKIFMYFFSSTI